MKLATEADRARWLAFVQAQTLPIDVSCGPWKATRSSEQNALLFGVVYPPIAEAMGYEVEAIHEYMLGTPFRMGGREGAQDAAQPRGRRVAPVPHDDPRRTRQAERAEEGRVQRVPGDRGAHRGAGGCVRAVGACGMKRGRSAGKAATKAQQAARMDRARELGCVVCRFRGAGASRGARRFTTATWTTSTARSSWPARRSGDVRIPPSRPAAVGLG